MPLAQDEHVLAGARRVGHVDVDETAVEERDERNRGRERAAGVEALVDGVAALLQRQQADVRVLDRQQLVNRLTDEVVIAGRRRFEAGCAA